MRWFAYIVICSVIVGAPLWLLTGCRDAVYQAPQPAGTPSDDPASATEDHHAEGTMPHDGEHHGHTHDADMPHYNNADGDTQPSGSLEDGVRTIRVAARKFEFEPETIVVNKGEEVKLLVTSEDVTHGIEIEDLDIDRELPPGKEQIITFSAGEAGEHHFHCSVYCGSGHDQMHGTLIVRE